MRCYAIFISFYVQNKQQRGRGAKKGLEGCSYPIFLWNLYIFSPFSGTMKRNEIFLKSFEEETNVCVLSLARLLLSLENPEQIWFIYVQKNFKTLFSIRQICPRANHVCWSAVLTSAMLIKLINYLIKTASWWSVFNFPSSSPRTASRATSVRFEGKKWNH